MHEVHQFLLFERPRTSSKCADFDVMTAENKGRTFTLEFYA